ncbi:hypothetical protein Dimus_030292 [Dionaea muscipula]
MVARYADILLGSSSRGVRRYLSSLPPSHELALVMRNVAENDRLNEELASEKARLTKLARAGMQLKADVVRISNEKQTVEEENRRLREELQKEKDKGKHSRERLVLIHKDLGDMSLKNERLHNTLDETYGKLIKIDQLEIDVKVPFQQEEILKIKKEPTEWSETYDIGILSYVKEWGKEIAEMFPMPSTSEAITYPPTSDAVPLRLGEPDAPPSPVDNVSKEKSE